MATVPSASRHEIVAWILAGVALLLVLQLRVLPALLAGLLVYQLVHILAPRLRIVRISEQRRKIVAVALLSAAIVVLITLAIVGLLAFLRNDSGSLPTLLAKMADILDSSRTRLPPSIAELLPASPAAMRATAADWLRAHADELRSVGKGFGIALAHVLIGLIIGAMISLREARVGEAHGPLAVALFERARRLGEAFRRIVFAQVRISALNTVLTGLYLGVVLPLLGIHLPLVKTMILVTFIAGLLPVIGNLISNTVIVIVSLSYSAGAAIGSLGFLVLIHKLEYFVNARIVGTQIRARAWELLIAMLVMEAAFGVPGVIAAPIFYAYIKDELTSRGLIGSAEY
jgi:predicted PurR-regulated permease PerM